jgi:hypothetical protein
MAHSFNLSRRIARLRAPVFGAVIVAFIGCDSTQTLDPESSLIPGAVDQGTVADVPLSEDPAAVEVMALGEPQLASASFAGGIPFGMAAQPLNQFNGRFNGAKRTIGPNQIMEELRIIRSRGGKVVIMLAGNPRHYRDGSGHFSLTKWKARINLFKGKSFSSYINDGTIIGHYLMDEPNDPRNWSGRPVSASMVEEMAKYSKQLWPGMPTIVRTQPDYLNFNHKYLDAAWAAYLWRRGNVNEYLRENVAAAQRRGLALVVGMNVLRGGNPNGTRMTASEVESWGSAMLSSSYPCAFLMWEYNSDYLSGAVLGAMDALRRKAENRSSKRCRA